MIILIICIPWTPTRTIDQLTKLITPKTLPKVHLRLGSGVWSGRPNQIGQPNLLSGSHPGPGSADRKYSVDRTARCHGMLKWVGRPNQCPSSPSRTPSAYRNSEVCRNLGKIDISKYIGMPNQTTQKTQNRATQKSSEMEKPTGPYTINQNTQPQIQMKISRRSTIWDKNHKDPLNGSQENTIQNKHCTVQSKTTTHH